MDGANASIVIPALDEADNIGALLDDCAAQDPGPREVIVVDAGSTDGTAELLAARAQCWPKLRVHTSPRANPGAARNAGIRAASAPVVATVDAGSRIEPGWLGSLLEQLGQTPGGRAVVGVTIPDARSSFERAAGWLSVTAFKPPGGAGPVGRAFLPAGRSGYCFTKQDWATAGGFPEELPWGEDKTFLRRLRQSGCEVVVAPRAVVRWRPRRSLPELYRQYVNYGRGDARAKVDRQNELVPLAQYGVALLLAASAASGKRRAGAALTGLAAGYLGLVTVAAVRDVRSLRALLWIPVLRVAVDVAKMHGFLAEALAPQDAPPSASSERRGSKEPRR